MNADMKDRRIRSLQAETIDDLAKSLKIIHKTSSGYNDLARQKNWNENRTMKEIEKESLRGLTKLDWHGTSLDLIKRELPKEQKRLMN